LLLDERTLAEGYGDIHQRISQLEREWSQSSVPVDGANWESAAAEVHRQLDDLGRRIDNNQP
jgi:virulence-associated protein VapD